MTDSNSVPGSRLPGSTLNWLSPDATTTTRRIPSSAATEARGADAAGGAGAVDAHPLKKLLNVMTITSHVIGDLGTDGNWTMVAAP